MITSSSRTISEELLADCYLLASVMFVNPEEMDRETTDDRINTLCEQLEQAGLEHVASHFKSFQKKMWDIDADEYLFALEMTPTAPPYLGHYGFDAPKSCGEIGVSERNMYMIEVAAVYKHYGILMDHGEMPDYFPAMCEFLAISLAETSSESRRLRKGFVDSLFIPFLPKFTKGLGTMPWAHITSAVAELVELEPEISMEVVD